MLVGFCAAGRAGKASAFLRLEEDCDRLGTGEAFAELDFAPEVPAAEGLRVSQPGVGAGGAAPAFGREGNGLFADAAVAPQDLCCPIADRELGAVALFNFSILDPPIPEPRAPAVDIAPEGPGREG